MQLDFGGFCRVFYCQVFRWVYQKNQLRVLGYLLRYQGWLSSQVVSMLESDADGPGSNRSRDSVR